MLTVEGHVLARLATFMLMKNGLDKLPKKVDAEQDMLDMAFEPNKFSRLACQITTTNELDESSRKSAIKASIIQL